jgi:hypothetical protein
MRGIVDGSAKGAVMIRGAIESLDEQFIQGWAYSALGPLEGVRVLAFYGDRCAGAGTIEIFRDDIAKAGLGDGISGFRFIYTLQSDEDPRRLTIRFENSDFQLLQNDAIVLPSDDPRLT